MPTNRYENLDSSQQRRILNAARAEFCRFGYEAASLNRIIAASGISKGSLYYYFENKADLYVTVVKDVSEETSAFIAEAPLPDPRVSFWDYIEVATRRKLEFAIRHPDLAQFGNEILRLSKQGSVWA